MLQGKLELQLSNVKYSCSSKTSTACAGRGSWGEKCSFICPMKSHSGFAAIWIAYNCHFFSLACVPQEITAGSQPCWRRAWWRAAQWQLQAAQLPQEEDLGTARSPVREVKSHGNRAEEVSRWGTSMSLTSSVAGHIFSSFLSNHSLRQLPTKAKLQD